MTTAALDTMVASLTSTVDYLRIAIGGPQDDAWLPCLTIVSDPAYLGSLAASTKAALGTDRDDVATSLFVQGYVFRIATVAVGSWLLLDTVIATDPATTTISLGRGYPNAVLLAPDSRILRGGGVDDVHATLIDGHLAALVATAHESTKVGAALLWGNVAASSAAAFGAFAGAPGARSAVIADRVETFFARACPELRAGGEVVRVGDRFGWKRTSCCLWYRTEGGFLCADCSLRSASEHEARFATLATE